MKNKILIFALCFTLLLGVFSISVYASEIDYNTDSFTFNDSLVFTGSVNSGSFLFGLSSSSNTTYQRIEVTFSASQYCVYFVRSDSGHKTLVYKDDHWIDDSYKTIYSKKVFSQATENLLSFLTLNGTFNVKHEHAYSSSTVLPTHVDKGYTLYTCSCGDTYKDNYVNALGHDYTIVTQPSTCTVKGSSTYTCSCGHSYTEALALLPHNYTVDVKPSTCTVKGYKVSTCTCGHVLRETLDLLPHSYSVLTKESTCSVPGSNTYTCSCGHSYSEKLPKLDHTFVEGRCSVCNALDPLLYKDSEDNILNAWREVYTDFFGLFGSAQSIFYDGSNLTLIGGLAIIGLVLVLGFLLFLVIEKFIHFRW